MAKKKTSGSAETLGLTADEKRFKVERILANSGLDPIKEIAALLQEKDANGNFVLSPKERVNANLSLMEFLVPKLKSVETKGEGEKPIRIIMGLAPAGNGEVAGPTRQIED